MIDTLKRYQEVRRKIEQERNAIVERLRQIDTLLKNADRLLGESAPPSRPAITEMRAGVTASGCEVY